MNSKTSRILVVAAALAFALAPAALVVAQTPPAASSQGGPVAVGQAQLDRDPRTGGVALVQAPAAPAKGGGFINIGQAFGDFMQPYVDAILQALILAGLTWLAAKVHQKTGIEIEQKNVDAAARAFAGRASSLIADGKVKMAGITVQVDSASLAAEANALLARMPDATKALGLTPEFVKQKIVDAIPQVPVGAAIVAAAHDQQKPQG